MKAMLKEIDRKIKKRLNIKKEIVVQEQIIKKTIKELMNHLKEIN